jgi:TPP-dependent pyruvate/acetoin dehydrogenase alpha subunit
MTTSYKDLIEFEKDIADHWLNGDITSLFHLGGGNENQLISIFNSIRPQDYVFASHRSHLHALLKGYDKNKLMKDILQGHSMFLFDKKINFFTSSILAGHCSIAAGVALSIKLRKEDRCVYCFLGDGASSEGHFYEAVKFVESNNLPCQFIIEDNDRSCDSTKEQRHDTADVINASCVMRYNYTPTYPHCQYPSDRKIIFK